MYQLVIDRSAQKQLSKIPPPHFNRIIKSINSLALNPRPPGCKKLTGRPGYRIRIGNYRVIYTIEDKILTVFVIDIGHRKDIYD
ncbi:MAG TPA: type II toxin-antitoxin system RelE/ParE family toxin [Chitinophagaceae bacterium]|jgi:mRNA interferase RelE/StbE|nr:type II toxin-antitoxin system RelE/ParE family toxin [Chitinophagaceae bacterium]